jgi:ABC-type phosphate transport system substrate-binding protein
METTDMLKLKQRVLVSTCALIAGISFFSQAALAQTYGKRDIFGGGASVPAPYARQTFDCYAKPTDLIIAGNPPTLEQIAPFNYKGNPPQDCATTHITTRETTYYISASAGTGILATFAHDPKLYGAIDGSGDFFPSLQFGMSTTPLISTDLNVYNNGGTETQGKSSVNIASPGQVSCTSGSNNPYPNPLQCYGPLVQFPFAITPIVFAYNAVYKKVLNSDGSETDYHFNLKYARSDGSGGLRLSPTTYCKIFNGEITNWNDPALTSDNGGQSLADPNDPDTFSVTLQIVGRSDSSGATSILSRHLANACASLSGNQYTSGSSTLPSSLLGPTYNTSNPNYPPVSGETPGKFTLAPNNSGVAQYVAFIATPGGSNPSNCSDGTACIQLGRITYSGTDYVLPYVAETQQNTYNLNSATLQNVSGNWEDPSASTAQAAYSGILPPQSTSTGQYCATCTDFGYRNDPTAWVQSTSPSAPIANPTNSGAYPVVGTANWIAYQCYASNYREKSLVGVMHYIDQELINTDAKKGILASAGLSPVSKPWKVAIANTFVSNRVNLGLNIAPVGAAGTCSGAGIVGG